MCSHIWQMNKIVSFGAVVLCTSYWSECLLWNIVHSAKWSDSVNSLSSIIAQVLHTLTSLSSSSLLRNKKLSVSNCNFQPKKVISGHYNYANYQLFRHTQAKNTLPPYFLTLQIKYIQSILFILYVRLHWISCHKLHFQIGFTNKSWETRVKEHSKSTTLAILKHCKDFHHLLPSISDFSIIDKDPSQITREAKEAIHMRRLDPNLNQNIGKMSIPHCFDPLMGARPKHPWVGTLSQTAPQPVDEIAPSSQIPGLNLTQFNNIGTFRPNVAQHIPKPSTRACRARNLFNWSSYQLSCLPHNSKQGQALYHLTRIE